MDGIVFVLFKKIKHNTNNVPSIPLMRMMIDGVVGLGRIFLLIFIVSFMN